VKSLLIPVGLAAVVAAVRLSVASATNHKPVVVPADAEEAEVAAEEMPQWRR